jgi:hypothetical protein
LIGLSAGPSFARNRVQRLPTSHVSGAGLKRCVQVTKASRSVGGRARVSRSVNWPPSVKRLVRMGHEDLRGRRHHPRFGYRQTPDGGGARDSPRSHPASTRVCARMPTRALLCVTLASQRLLSRCRGSRISVGHRPPSAPPRRSARPGTIASRCAPAQAAFANAPHYRPQSWP